MSLTAKRFRRVRAGVAAAPEVDSVSQFVAFRLGSLQCGLDITRVQEVTPVSLITKRSELPGFLAGIIHRHGRAIPIVDLCTRFNRPPAGAQEHARIIVAIVHDRTIGFIVDGATDVVRIRADQIHAAPGIKGIDTACIAGCARIDANELILLNIDKVISQDEVKQLPDMAE